MKTYYDSDSSIRLYQTATKLAYVVYHSRGNWSVEKYLLDREGYPYSLRIVHTTNERTARRLARNYVGR